MFKLIIGIFAVAFVAAAVYFIGRRGQTTRCPKCGRAFAMGEVSRDKAPVSTCDTTAHIGLFTLDLRGNITTADPHAVPATAYTYSCVDECRFCGFQKEEQRTQICRK